MKKTILPILTLLLSICSFAKTTNVEQILTWSDFAGDGQTAGLDEISLQIGLFQHTVTNEATALGLARWYLLSAQDAANAEMMLTPFRNLRPESLNLLAMTWERQGRLEEALSAYQKVFSSDPSAVYAAINAVKLLIEKENTAGAAHLIALARGANKNSHLLDIINVLPSLRTGDLRSASLYAAFSVLSEDSSEHRADYYWLISLMYEGRGDYVRALDYLKAAAADDPLRPEISAKLELFEAAASLRNESNTMELTDAEIRQFKNTVSEDEVFLSDAQIRQQLDSVQSLLTQGRFRIASALLVSLEQSPGSIAHKRRIKYLQAVSSFQGKSFDNALLQISSASQAAPAAGVTDEMILRLKIEIKSALDAQTDIKKKIDMWRLNQPVWKQAMFLFDRIPLEILAPYPPDMQLEFAFSIIKAIEVNQTPLANESVIISNNNKSSDILFTYGEDGALFGTVKDILFRNPLSGEFLKSVMTEVEGEPSELELYSLNAESKSLKHDYLHPEDRKLLRTTQTSKYTEESIFERGLIELNRNTSLVKEVSRQGSEELMVYRKNGREVITIRIRRQQGVPVQRFTYDSKNRLLDRIDWIWDDGKLTGEERYSGAGRRIESRIYTWMK